MDANLVFILMVGAAVFLLAQGLIVPVFGESKQVRKRLEQRLGDIERNELDGITSILRQKYLDQLSPAERWLESLPYMQDLNVMIEQAGHHYRAYRVMLLALGAALGAAFVTWAFWRMPMVSAAAALIMFSAPFLKIRYDRNQRFAKFEEQMPDAIDVMRRALLAGHPFNSALKMAAEDMDDPIAGELEITFSDINYGNDVRRALLGLLGRVPSVIVMALVTSILVQRETGGNLAEILGQISTVIRGRFRFHRKVRTLSAEGRMSAWVLAMVPLGLFLVINLTTPEYFPVMFETPLGQQLVTVTFIWACLGVYFIKRIIRIDV